MRNILIKGNMRMGDEVYIFNLPPLKTCCPTPWCRQNCYALKGNFRRFPSVRKSAEWRYKVSRLPDFVERVVKEIKQRHIRIVRLHASGDFYSRAYVKKWIVIARQCPNVRFRTTTKRHDLTDIICELNGLPNFIIRESIDPSCPKPIMGLTIAAIDTTPNVQKLLKEGKIIRCINDCKKCGYICWHNRVGICFTQH